MPLPINHSGNLRKQFLKRQLSTTSAGNNSYLTERQKENVKKHITRYRRNWDIFVEEVFQIKLYPIQKIIIHMMGISQEFMAIATRGAAKSFLCGLASLVCFCLYPYSEIVITSSTIPQASKLVEKKIRDELIKKLSPYLLYMYEHEYIVITKSNTSDGGAYTIENKLNGSTISVLACLESSRGARSTLNIYEEARLLKKSIIDSVFEPMGHARQAKYLLNPKYNTRRWQEKARSFYITSARYSYEWFARKYQDIFENYFESKHEVYIPFAEDIFAAIEDGSRTWADYRKNKKSMSEVDFKMEILNEMFNQNEDAFFDFKSFKDNQVLTQSADLPTSKDTYGGKFTTSLAKEPNEIRLIISDFAFSGNNSKEKNDNTVFMCMSLHWKDFRFERHVDYVETRPGGGADKLVLHLKELYYGYQADYIVYDNRSGGEVIYDYLSGKTANPSWLKWNDSGFTVIDEKDLHFVPDGKVAELSGRTIDPNAIKCLVPFIGTAEANSLGWQSLKKQLETNNIKFLCSMQDAQTALEDSGEIYDLTSEQLADKLAPFGQTDLMIQECVNLSAEFKNGLVRLVEPRSSYKDRAVVLSYGNFFAEKLDIRYSKNMSEEDIDVEDIQLVY